MGLIQIYNGNGSSSICYDAFYREIDAIIDKRCHAIEPFNQYNSHKLDGRQVSLICLLGGNASYMFPELSELSEKINMALDNKSAFFGSGAGAMVGGSSIYANGLNQKISFSICSQLYLHNLDTYVPYYSPDPKKVTNPVNKTIVEINCFSELASRQTFRVFHGWEPGFLVDSENSNNPSYKTLATYVNRTLNLPGKEVAAAFLHKPSSLNNKPRLFTGVQLECGPEEIEKYRLQHKNDEFNSSDHFSLVSDTLEASAKIRKDIFRNWMSELGIALTPDTLS